MQCNLQGLFHKCAPDTAKLLSLHIRTDIENRDVLDSNFKNPTGTRQHRISNELFCQNQIFEYLLHSDFFGFLCGMNEKSIIPRACCFQLCVLMHCVDQRLLYVKELVYMTPALFRKVQVTSFFKCTHSSQHSITTFQCCKLSQHN